MHKGKLSVFRMIYNNTFIETKILSKKEKILKIDATKLYNVFQYLAPNIKIPS